MAKWSKDEEKYYKFEGTMEGGTEEETTKAPAATQEGAATNAASPAAAPATNAASPAAAPTTNAASPVAAPATDASTPAAAPPASPDPENGNNGDGLSNVARSGIRIRHRGRRDTKGAITFAVSY